jgi:hypothetical protein
MVPLMIGIMFSQTEILREAWKENAEEGISSMFPDESLVSQCSVSEVS